ncbi:predicted phospholipase A2 [Aromatoleum aromaticum EbN1]|uniref:Predicted phospholipase A2 n=2 Tax=Aromatoleum aromaticum TaxID=551760 RepID=Q5P713_AROAE|nr:predicted phospholipase A2 [Aromatoleum aromaticum EbN1]
MTDAPRTTSRSGSSNGLDDRMNLQLKIWLGVAAVILTIMSADLYLGYRGIETQVRAGLDEHARVVRALLMATRRVYQQQFLASGLPVDERTLGFLPAHALSCISGEFPRWISTGLWFNNVSDRPRNPDNRADAHEMAAMDWFRQHPAVSERIAEIRDEGGRDVYHFSAPIWLEPYCLRCHGERDTAPATIRDTYEEAYGYKVGDLRGLMSIKLPMDEVRVRAAEIWWQQFGLRSGGYALLLVLLGALLQRLVVRPLRELRTVTQQVAQGELSVRAVVSGRDEVAELATSFNDMAAALACHDAQYARLNRIYAALSATNQMIVRVDSEPELLRRTCQIAVELGGVAMAWIGRRDPDSGNLVPVARFGEGGGYVDGLVIPLEPCGPESAGPTATAWRSNQPVIVEDYLAESTTRPWHAGARKFGWRSAAAFPILRGGQVHLVLNLYDTNVQGFDVKMRDLITEMVADIGYALDRIDLVAEQARTSAALRESEVKYRKVLETSQDGFWLLNRDWLLTEVNDAYIEFSGYRREELVGMHVTQLDASDASEMARHIASAVEDGNATFETRHRTKSGELKPVEVSVTFDAGRAACFSLFVRDLSRRDEAQEHIRRLSHFDTLTGLPNSSLFADLLRQAIGNAQRSGESLSVMYIDIDHFQHINDTLGHRIGDRLLVEIAGRFRNALCAENTLARLGGDEFLILLPHAQVECAAHVAEKLIVAAADPMLIEDHEMLVTPSIGIAMYPADGEDFETLLQRADTATNRAKSDGRNTYRFFAPEMQLRSAHTLRLETALRRALERNELVLHYQPQIDLVDFGRVAGVEALIRWQHPEFGLVSPAEFIPIAESTGLILPIGEWVMQTALLQLKAWQLAGLQLGQVGVNLSAHQFRQQNLPATVARILAEAGLPASCLELELTESAMMDDPVAAVAMMDALHRDGVRMSIDDFGTGYSSLNYLKRFRIDKLKIDQSFVRDLTQDPEGEAIVEAIVSLARTLRFRTIAEGVEKPEQLAFLRASGCQEVQGYLFSRPLPPDELAVWLRAWRPELAAK